MKGVSSIDSSNNAIKNTNNYTVDALTPESDSLQTVFFPSKFPSSRKENEETYFCKCCDLENTLAVVYLSCEYYWEGLCLDLEIP